MNEVFSELVLGSVCYTCSREKDFLIRIPNVRMAREIIADVMKAILPLLVLLICVSCFGCASWTAVQFVPLPDQSKTVEDQEKGRVYVIHAGIYDIDGSGKAKVDWSVAFLPSGRMEPLQVRVNGKSVGRLLPPFYLCWEEMPGATSISSSSRSGHRSSLNLSVEKGRVYYIIPQWHSKTGSRFGYSLEEVTEEAGKRALELARKPRVELK